MAGRGTEVSWQAALTFETCEQQETSKSHDARRTEQEEEVATSMA